MNNDNYFYYAIFENNVFIELLFCHKDIINIYIINNFNNINNISFKKINEKDVDKFLY